MAQTWRTDTTLGISDEFRKALLGFRNATLVVINDQLQQRTKLGQQRSHLLKTNRFYATPVGQHQLAARR